ncbi:putative NAD-dependent epimerase/dehydratase [Actinoplanes missouriensis 431]|uniref:Putative NAD-dependent epimerase/dehydratase n=1 Tax=Actinoplanes missouriensis (strain ATCC 14538 / DSM 43046 / CBS 188.64 / JCM 3121 / NBRC 102363 / NCIMB 12654 / NRRL B-3342 / UNCC 431) TaxID=512565 RepID=I0H581_ACTM4|nr:NAD-dependent epimerase/dehydratase family protein [Actinoplanes missouriensis]BAL88168.1 putative NAD-dependent epimerase/dehydratase [Actinoplanes missouriensis 431]
MKRVLLTGATGNWGRRILAEFAARADRFRVVALVLPGDRAAAAELAGMPNLEVVHGDLTDYPTVERCVRGADYVLHVGAVVSPYADDHPELAHQVNVGSARNIIDAVRAQPDPGATAVVMVGSVAETGDRNPPVHWGRVGDPLRVSHFDEYGQTKIIAERLLVDSGLPRWAWVRQTGIFHPGMLRIRDAIMTHSPFAGVMEWVSAEDAARLMAGICEEGVPDEFWGGVYNIGGGEGWQLTNWQLQTAISAALGVKDVRTWYDRNWFATRNFHGQWYTDSDRLDDLVPFRRDTFAQALERAVTAVNRHLAQVVHPA